MIVYCEECGHKNQIEDASVKGKEPRVPCQNCGDLLWFYGKKADALAKKRAAKAQKAEAAAETADQEEMVPDRCLILKYGKVVVVVNDSNRRVEIGRQKSNDIQVVNNRVSRTHALIELKDGKYYLTDQSSNGTYLLMEGRKAVTVRKKAIQLTDKGVIGPGYKVDAKSPDAIHMRFEAIP